MTALSNVPATSPAPARLLVLDVLRGISLLGIAALNVPSILHFSATADASSKAVYFYLELLFRSHFFPVFSLLFGVSFAMIMASRERHGQPAGPTLLRRLGVLAVFGLIHQLFQPGEALLPYAIFGLLLLPFRSVPLPLVFVASALITLLALWTASLFLVPAMFLLGLGLQRLRVFERGEALKPLLGKLWPVLTALAAMLTSWHTGVFYNRCPLLEIAGFGFDLGTLAGLVGAGAWVSAAWLLTLHWPSMPLWRPLSLLGRMSLTNYMCCRPSSVACWGAGLAGRCLLAGDPRLPHGLQRQPDLQFLVAGASLTRAAGTALASVDWARRPGDPEIDVVERVREQAINLQCHCPNPSGAE